MSMYVYLLFINITIYTLAVANNIVSIVFILLLLYLILDNNTM